MYVHRVPFWKEMGGLWFHSYFIGGGGVLVWSIQQGGFYCVMGWDCVWDCVYRCVYNVSCVVGIGWS